MLILDENHSHSKTREKTINQTIGAPHNIFNIKPYQSNASWHNTCFDRMKASLLSEKTLQRFVISIFLFMLSCSIQAEWIESTASAIIEGDKIERAREVAIKKAVNAATYKAGLKISSQQTVINGLIKEQYTKIEYRGEFHRVEVLSEDKIGNEYVVALRIEVNEKSKYAHCKKSPIRSSILIVQAEVLRLDHLRYGKIFGLESSFVERLEKSMLDDAVAFFPRLHTNSRLNTHQTLDDTRGYRIPNWLAFITNTQYILIPRLLDLSTTPVLTHWGGLFEDTPNREFQIQMSLYHGISGELLWNQHYQQMAPWNFPRNQQVDPKSSTFWDSDYGQAINKTIADIVHDLDQKLTCHPTIGQIIARNSESIMINLGRRHGVKKNDEFQIILTQNLFDRLSQVRIQPHPSKTKIIVESVTEYSSSASLKDESASLNIQTNDLVILSTHFKKKKVINGAEL